MLSIATNELNYISYEMRPSVLGIYDLHVCYISSHSSFFVPPYLLILGLIDPQLYPISQSTES